MFGVPEGDGDDGGLVAQPREGGPETAGQVGVGLAPGGGRVDGVDAPLDPAALDGIDQVVAGDGADGVGLELDPGPVVGFGAEDDLEGAVVGDVEMAGR